MHFVLEFQQQNYKLKTMFASTNRSHNSRSTTIPMLEPSVTAFLPQMDLG